MSSSSGPPSAPISDTDLGKNLITSMGTVQFLPISENKIYNIFQTDNSGNNLTYTTLLQPKTVVPPSFDMKQVNDALLSNDMDVLLWYYNSSTTTKLDDVKYKLVSDG